MVAALRGLLGTQAADTGWSRRSLRTRRQLGACVESQRCETRAARLRCPTRRALEEYALRRGALSPHVVGDRRGVAAGLVEGDVEGERPDAGERSDGADGVPGPAGTPDEVEVEGGHRALR